MRAKRRTISNRPRRQVKTSSTASLKRKLAKPNIRVLNRAVRWVKESKLPIAYVTRFVIRAVSSIRKVSS